MAVQHEEKVYHVPYTAEQIQASIGKNPIPSEPDEEGNHYWMIWDTAKMDYVKTDVKTTDPNGITPEQADKRFLKLDGGGNVKGNIVVTSDSDNPSSVEITGDGIQTEGADSEIGLHGSDISISGTLTTIKPKNQNGASDLYIEIDKNGVMHFKESYFPKGQDRIKIGGFSTDYITFTMNDSGQVVLRANQVGAEEKKTRHRFALEPKDKANPSFPKVLSVDEAMADDEVTTLGQVKTLISESDGAVAMTNEEIDKIMEGL